MQPPKQQRQEPAKSLVRNLEEHGEQKKKVFVESKLSSFEMKAQRPMVRRALSKLNRKRRRLRSKINESLRGWDEMEYAERQNSVGTLDLFKYALRKEQLAVALGIIFMWYAASWQPISVFILAIMASLMGQYSKQTSWLQALNSSEPNSSSSSTNETTVDSFLARSIQAAPMQTTLGPSPLSPHVYEAYHFLGPLYSLVGPIFDLTSAHAHSTTNATSSAGDIGNDEENIKAALHDILQHESNQFLRKSFEINGSAFLLALTQLLAFFVGLNLITWAAKKQASRVKILYFNSCLHQEVTWFEAIDSASGSGSSLNALVDKYEDGIGMKLALLSYFLGHVALFACTAFYQMFNLAAFCMPFVLLVGLVIGYLSEWQAVAIGQQALFAKRALQLAEEILAAIRTVLAFNGQQKETTRYTISLQPVYRRSLIKHLYTALNTSLSKFSIFACFAAYCFYAMRLFPPYADTPLNKSTVLAVMRGAEVSIVNILISIPFMEALQQSKGSIARIYAAIERRSKINPANTTGAKPAPGKWLPSISFRMVQFGYADRSGPTNRKSSTLPFLNLPGSPGSNQQQQQQQQLQQANGQSNSPASGEPNIGRRKQSLIEDLADELEMARAARGVTIKGTKGDLASAQATATGRPSAAIKRIMGGELQDNKRPNKRILNYFNLEIKAGQSVALVGPSGSGKSTVLSLVQRLYDITGGQLLVGQHNIKDLSVGWLRNQIGVVTQEPRLFDMSIAENIRLGLPGKSDRKAQLDEEEFKKQEQRRAQQVVEAAQAAGAHEFISRLPEGYSTRVGSGGVQLSGGQKQRIAIARALIRKPKILLLDESTSALDTESEAQVQLALKAASAGRTTLTVAHRLETIKHVDLIVVMYQGQVVECGSHSELMAKGERGIYRQMYEDQLAASSGPGHQSSEDEQESEQRKQKAQQVRRKRNLEKSCKLSALNRFGLKEKEVDYEEEGVSNSDSDSNLEEEEEEEEEDDEYEEDEEYDSNSCYSSSTTSSAVSLKHPTFLQLWSFVEMPKWSSLAACFVCLLAGLILPLNLIAHSYLFSAFAYAEPEQLSDYLHVFGLVVLSFSTFVFIVSFLQIILPGYVGEKLSVRLRIKTMDSLLQKPMFYFDMDSNSAGSLCDRFNSYISNIQSIAGTRVATMLEALSTLMAGAFFGFGQNFALSSFCLSFALLVLLTTILESRIVQRESSLQQKFDAQLAHLMADALSNIKTVASLNKEKFFIDRFGEIIRQREIGTGRCVLWLRTFLTSLKFVMPAMSWSASMFYGCLLLVDNRIDIQTIFIVCPVVLFAVNDTFRALVFLPELLKARKSIERLYKMNREFSPQVLQQLTLGQQLEQQNQLHLEQQQAAAATASLTASTTGANINKALMLEQTQLDKQKEHKKINTFSVKPEVCMDLDEGVAEDSSCPSVLVNRRLSTVGQLPTYMRRKSSRLNSLVPRQQARGRIEFSNVEFAYPNRPSALVLDGFSLNVAPGESVALVGGSGSGKSTCVSILEKFYDYHAGKVTLDGLDLRLVDCSWTRSQIGLVSQEPTLLSYTIGDNIRYGDNSRFVSMDEVVEAARTANIHDFIMSLPDQYDTELSNSAYSSSQLSGGQRQRIAIARALIRNAPILIFDEATSALDSRNESVVQDALNKARRGRTSLTIAHRLATVKEADKIAVLREGRVVEVGKHEELLLREHGHYRKLWQRQAGANQPSEVESDSMLGEQQAVPGGKSLSGLEEEEGEEEEEKVG